METPEKTIAQYAFDRACGFNLAAKVCEQQPLLIEAVVCYAFSVEVGLKAIVMHESQVSKVEGGHHLEKLFFQLKGTTQGHIKAAVNDPSFDKRLTEVNKDFVDWRYVYEAQENEKKIGSWIGFLRELSNAAIDAAKAIIPPPPKRPDPTPEQIAAFVEEMTRKK